MLVRDVMRTPVLALGPAHTLRQAARLMYDRCVGVAVVLDPDTGGLGLLTQRAILRALGRGQDPDRETVQAHLTCDVVVAAPDWTLRGAAATLTRRGLTHLVVVDEREPVGTVSVRDLTPWWAPSTTPGRPAAAGDRGAPPRPRHAPRGATAP